MIPPFLETAFAKPAIKWGTIGGAVAILLVSTNWKTYDYMREQCEQSKLAALAVQAQDSAKQALQGAKMSSAVVGETDRKASELMEKVTAHERKVASYVKTIVRPCTLEPGLMQQLDEYGRMLNESTVKSMPSADGGAGEPAVSGGGLGSPDTAFVLQEEDGEPVELTAEELNQYLADRTRQFGRNKLKHWGLSDFEIRRQRIEGAIP